MSARPEPPILLPRFVLSMLSAVFRGFCDAGLQVDEPCVCQAPSAAHLRTLLLLCCFVFAAEALPPEAQARLYLHHYNRLPPLYAASFVPAAGCSALCVQLIALCRMRLFPFFPRRQ